MKNNFSARRSLFGGKITMVCPLAVLSIIALASASLSSTSAFGQERSQGATEKAETKKSTAEKQSRGKRKGRRGRRGRGGPATVVVDPVKKGSQSETVLVYGRIVADQAGNVAARTRGAIAKVFVRVGDRVKKGQTLATLITSMLEAERSLRSAEVRENKASVKRADAQLSLAQQELRRLERLRKSAAFSVARYNDKRREVERFRSAKAEAEAKADQAKAELRMANINLNNAKVQAPFSGVVTVLHVEVGTYVNVGTNVATLVDDSSLEVEAEVPGNRVGGLDQGRSVDVLPEFGKEFKASVRAVIPEENALSRTRLVRFIPSENFDIRRVAANQSVRLRIPAGPTRVAVTVHKDAITVRRGKKVVFVVDKDKMTAALREVELGETFGSRFEVLKGLNAGDRVVVRGNERLRPNQKVRIQGSKRRGEADRGQRRRGSRDRNGNPTNQNERNSNGEKSNRRKKREGSRS